MNITLRIGTLDVHEKVSTYNVRREVSYSKVITTMDDTEHAVRSKDRYIVETSFFPILFDRRLLFVLDQQNLRSCVFHLQKHQALSVIRNLVSFFCILLFLWIE